MWHVQLALFFVAASFLAMESFDASHIGKPAEHQEKLAIGLFAAIVLVVIAASPGSGDLKNMIPLHGPCSGSERGMDVYRSGKTLANAPHPRHGVLVIISSAAYGADCRVNIRKPALLFLYSSISIPAFYALGMVFARMSICRHGFLAILGRTPLVEDFSRIIHHDNGCLYFRPSRHVKEKVRPGSFISISCSTRSAASWERCTTCISAARRRCTWRLGFFSAMEVIPLLLLTVEAWQFMQLGKAERSRSLRPCERSRTTGGNVFNRGRILEFSWSGRVRVPDQSADCQLLRDRDLIHLEPRPRRAHGRVRNARHGFFMFVARHFIVPTGKANSR